MGLKYRFFKSPETLPCCSRNQKKYQYIFPTPRVINRRLSLPSAKLRLPIQITNLGLRMQPLIQSTDAVSRTLLLQLVIVQSIQRKLLPRSDVVIIIIQPLLPDALDWSIVIIQRLIASDGCLSGLVIFVLFGVEVEVLRNICSHLIY